eukprot:3336395-Prymnesium_polylepis.1
MLGRSSLSHARYSGDAPRGRASSVGLDGSCTHAHSMKRRRALAHIQLQLQLEQRRQPRRAANTHKASAKAGGAQRRP